MRVVIVKGTKKPLIVEKAEDVEILDPIALRDTVKEQEETIRKLRADLIGFPRAREAESRLSRISNYLSLRRDGRGGIDVETNFVPALRDLVNQADTYGSVAGVSIESRWGIKL